jgi:hypothetical protein
MAKIKKSNNPGQETTTLGAFYFEGPAGVEMVNRTFAEDRQGAKERNGRG